MYQHNHPPTQLSTSCPAESKVTQAAVRTRATAFIGNPTTEITVVSGFRRPALLIIAKFAGTSEYSRCCPMLSCRNRTIGTSKNLLRCRVFVSIISGAVTQPLTFE
jgi:hypothetical protein